MCNYRFKNNCCIYAYKTKKSQHDLSLKHGKWLTKKFKNVEISFNWNLEKLFKSFETVLLSDLIMNMALQTQEQD